MTTFAPGLEGIIAAETTLSQVNGEQGELLIGGYPVEELAEKASHEEVIFLLWNKRRASPEERKAFEEELKGYRQLPAVTLELLEKVAAAKTPVMDALRMSLSTLEVGEHFESVEKQAKVILARFPLLIASYWRLLRNQKVIAPHPTLSQAANYWYMLFGEEPSEVMTRALETYLNTVIDHGLNASTFTARVIISTKSDLLSALVGALGALKGPLHGGAPGPALEMVFEIGETAKAESYLRKKLEAGERLMGFGHRVYKVRDPRAEVLGRASKKLFESAEQASDLYELTQHVEETAIRLLEEFKPGRRLQTNVEFYTALLLHGVGLSTELFTPTFALSRMAGWVAHCFEQLETGRLIRPKAQYCGPRFTEWTV